MIRLVRKLRRDQSGATLIEMAFALPILIVIIWTLFQYGLVFRANSGIQHALGEGARLATIFPTPDESVIEARMAEAVYGIGPGEFDYAITPVDDPETPVDESEIGYLDLTVTYTQKTSLLLVPGPTITISKTKRAWSAI
jgi:Flp pilus assembly pilin Flp